MSTMPNRCLMANSAKLFDSLCRQTGKQRPAGKRNTGKQRNAGKQRPAVYFFSVSFGQPVAMDTSTAISRKP